MASATTNNADVQAELPGTDWFSVATHPTATFNATRFRHVSGDRYSAAGTLSLFEVPAGLLDESEPEEGARREAFEETGVRLGALDRVATGWTMPGVSTEQMDLFLGAYAAADRIGTGGGLASESEDITVHEMPLADLAAMSDRGEITDLKTLVLLLTLRLRRPELFSGA